MPEISILVKAKDQASKALKGVGKSVGGLTEKLGGMGIIGPAAIAGVGLAVGKLAWDAMELEPTRITFDNLTESIGSTADAMLEELRPATLGVVSDADLMASANKLISMGLAESAEEAAKLSKMAVTLGTAMGKKATPAMEEFALMLANQSIPRLDTFGISAGKVRTRINELMEADKSLTRETAFMTAVMEQGEISMERVGDVSDTTSIKMQRIRTAVDNLKVGIGEMLIPVLDAGATAFLDFQKSQEDVRIAEQELREETYLAVESKEEYAEAIIKAKKEQYDYTSYLYMIGEAQIQARLETEYATKAFEALVGPLDKVIEAAWNLDAEMKIQAGLIDDTAEAVDGAVLAYGDWATALDEVERVIKEHENYVEALKKAAGYAEELGLKEAENVLQHEATVESLKDVGEEAKITFVDKMLESVDSNIHLMPDLEGKIHEVTYSIEGMGMAFDEPISKLEVMGRRIEGLPSYKRIDIDIYEHYHPSGPYSPWEEAIQEAGMYSE